MYVRMYVRMLVQLGGGEVGWLLVQQGVKGHLGSEIK